MSTDAPSTESATQTYPWTPGQWYVADRRTWTEKGSGLSVIAVFSEHGDERPLVGYTTHDDRCDVGSAEADAALVALAPEMAEAILRRWGGQPDTFLARVADASTPSTLADQTSAKVALKLREIGATRV